MEKMIKAFYDKGTLKLSKPLNNVENHQELELMIISKESPILKTAGIFKTSSKNLKEIAESKELIYEN